MLKPVRGIACKLTSEYDVGCLRYRSLITMVSVMLCFVTKSTPVHRKLRYVSKCKKTCSAGCTGIYSLGGGHTHACHTRACTHTHTPTSRTKVISRNQVHTSFWLVRAWFNNRRDYPLLFIVMPYDSSNVSICV